MIVSGSEAEFRRTFLLAIHEPSRERARLTNEQLWKGKISVTNNGWGLATKAVGAPICNIKPNPIGVAVPVLSRTRSLVRMPTRAQVRRNPGSVEHGRPGRSVDYVPLCFRSANCF